MLEGRERERERQTGNGIFFSLINKKLLALESFSRLTLGSRLRTDGIISLRRTGLR